MTERRDDLPPIIDRTINSFLIRLPGPDSPKDRPYGLGLIPGDLGAVDRYAPLLLCFTVEQVLLRSEAHVPNWISRRGTAIPIFQAAYKPNDQDPTGMQKKVGILGRMVARLDRLDPGTIDAVIQESTEALTNAGHVEAAKIFSEVRLFVARTVGAPAIAGALSETIASDE